MKKSVKKPMIKKAQKGRVLEAEMKSAGKAKADSITNAMKSAGKAKADSITSRMKSSADSILKNYKPIFKENNPAYKNSKAKKK